MYLRKMTSPYLFTVIMGKIICATIGADIHFGISAISGRLRRSDKPFLLM